MLRNNWTVWACALLTLLTIAGCATSGQSGGTKFTTIGYGNQRHFVPPQSHERLNALASQLANNGALFVRITGHAYDVRSSGQNMRIAGLRAEGAKQYLVDAGVDPDRIATDSRGDVAPQIRYDNFGERRRGNRVEIFVIGAEAP
jgi:outer membrane protein OmpA-like peptidoglycan-associated protein